jgi:nucleotide-binding universal stress UspA family protein
MRLKEILFPTDFSTASETAGRTAREMALQAGGRLHVVHVIPPVIDPAAATEHLARAAARLGDGVTVETVLLSGHVVREILAYARDKRIDLIVLGTHGRTGVSRAILGSVAESVVRLAPCLVLTVPSSVLAAGEPVAAPVAEAPHRCLACAGETEELICEACRTRIRGEALERKMEAERAGRRGSPV